MCEGEREKLFPFPHHFPSIKNTSPRPSINDNHLRSDPQQVTMTILKISFPSTYTKKKLLQCHSSTLQLKKREKIPDIECLEQMEMIKNEIDLFLDHHQALCQQTSPSLLDYLR
jgi:hypothetical protein